MLPSLCIDDIAILVAEILFVLFSTAAAAAFEENWYHDEEKNSSNCEDDSKDQRHGILLDHLVKLYIFFFCFCLLGENNWHYWLNLGASLLGDRSGLGIVTHTKWNCKETKHQESS